MHPTSVMMQEEGIAARVVDFVEKNFVRVFLQDCKMDYFRYQTMNSLYF